MSSGGYSNIRTVALSAERPNLIGEVGSSGPVLMLNGHLDTKPPGAESEWESGPYEPAIRTGRLYGLGSTDMKGAVAAMIFAGAALAEVGVPTGTVKVVLGADEEAGSRHGAHFLAGRPDAAADAAIVGEPTGMATPWAYLAVASRGIACYRVSVRGTQMHSSLSDQVRSVNASVKLAQVLTRMAAAFRPRYPVDARTGARPTVNLGVTLEGGVIFGVYPGHAQFGIDIRTVPGMTASGLAADFAFFLEEMRSEDPDLDVSAEPVPELGWFPPSAIDPGHPLVTAASSAAGSVLGREVPLGVMPAFTDGTHWHLAGIPCIPAFGPGSLLLAHQPNEYVTVEEIVQAARIYALTALRFLSADPDVRRPRGDETGLA
jgi:acetylornithine deacetylase/succinyl-diaminopimelate desuccinylase-like protein